MILKELRKIYQGKFLTYYIADYINKNGDIKSYEFTSRRNDLTLETFGNTLPAGVGLVPFSKDKEKILLQAEFRLATNQVIYNFPAGLIDRGETPEMAAKRELFEETGLELIKILDVLPISFASPGTSDEAMQVVVCLCDGELRDSIFVDEEIHASFFTKEEVRKLFKEGAKMSVRTQMFLWQWINEDK